MEAIIENAIDNGLESIASGLYFCGIVSGCALLVAGVILFISNKIAKNKKSITNASLICIVIGIIAIVSSILQI